MEVIKRFPERNYGAQNAWEKRSFHSAYDCRRRDSDSRQFSIEFRAIKDAIEDKLNSFNFGEIILSGLGGTVGAGVIGKGIGQLIFKAFKGSAVSKAITAGGGAISTGLIGAAIGGIVAGIPMFVTGVYDAIMNGLNILNGLLIPAGSTLAATGIGAIIGTAIGSVGGLLVQLSAHSLA